MNMFNSYIETNQVQQTVPIIKKNIKYMQNMIGYKYWLFEKKQPDPESVPDNKTVIVHGEEGTLIAKSVFLL